MMTQWHVPIIQAVLVVSHCLPCDTCLPAVLQMGELSFVQAEVMLSVSGCSGGWR
jgi:hypothetical protein